MDAPLLHEEVDEVLLLTPDFSEVMQILPHIDVEVVFDALDNGAFACLGDVVVDSWVMGLVIRDLYCDLSLLPSSRQGARWELYGGSLQEFALDGATYESHGFVAPVAVDEPLAEVGWHFQVDAVFAHGCKVSEYSNELDGQVGWFKKDYVCLSLHFILLLLFFE